MIWSGWEKLVSRLALTELAPLVRKAHEAELLIESAYEEFQEDLEYAVAHPDAPCRPGDELQAFADVQELESWVEIVMSRAWWQSSPEAPSTHCLPVLLRTRRIFVCLVIEGFHSAAHYVR